MNSLAAHPFFFQIAQDAALRCAPATAAAPSGVLGVLDHWQTLVGALSGGLLGVVGALVVAVMIRRRERRIAAAMVLPDLQQLSASHGAVMQQIRNFTAEDQVTAAVNALLVRRPRVAALHTQTIGQLTDIDARLYSHLFQCEMIHAAFETGMQDYAANRQALMDRGFDMPLRALPHANPTQVFHDWQLSAEHATLATYYLDRLAFSRWPRMLQLLRMRLRPNDVDRRSSHLLETGEIKREEQHS